MKLDMTEVSMELRPPSPKPLNMEEIREVRLPFSVKLLTREDSREDRPSPLPTAEKIWDTMEPRPLSLTRPRVMPSICCTREVSRPLRSMVRRPVQFRKAPTPMLCRCSSGISFKNRETGLACVLPNS